LEAKGRYRLGAVNNTIHISRPTRRRRYSHGGTRITKPSKQGSRGKGRYHQLENVKIAALRACNFMTMLDLNTVTVKWKGEN